MIDVVFCLGGLEAMKNFKADEISCLKSVLGIELDARRIGFLDGFFFEADESGGFHDRAGAHGVLGGVRRGRGVAPGT